MGIVLREHPTRTNKCTAHHQRKPINHLADYQPDLTSDWRVYGHDASSINLYSHLPTHCSNLGYRPASIWYYDDPELVHWSLHAACWRNLIRQLCGFKYQNREDDKTDATFIRRHDIRANHGIYIPINQYLSSKFAF